jgi:UDP-N-acetylmuramate dehydrogenase
LCAGEAPIRGVTSALIAKHIKGKKWSPWDAKKGFDQLLEELEPGDVLLTLGAGDVWKIGEAYLKEGHSLKSRLAEAVPALVGRIKAEEPLARHCTWAIGGPAEIYLELETLAELKGVQRFCQEERVPFFILGWGSNVLLPDAGLRGVVVRLRGEFENIEFSGDHVKVGAGVHLPKLARRCAEKSLSGTEALAGVPGTVGGALITNAGTPRGVIGDVVESVVVLNPDGTTETLSRDRLELRYRHSNLSGRWIVSASLSLKPSHNGDVDEKIKHELDMRAKTQPLGTKNVGSVFKNPPNDFAARLIEAAGLKGHRQGRVRFSPKHANFIENTGGATAKEAMELIQLAQKTIKEKFSIDLELEVNVVAQPPALSA